MLCQFFYIATFFRMGNGNRSITYFYIINIVIAADGYIIVKLVTYKKCFKQGAPKINRYIIRLIHLNLFPEIWCYKRSSETELYYIDMWMRDTHKIMNLIYTKPFVHYHCNTITTWFRI